MPIVIKKKVDLDFLGEEYKDAYLVFRSIPLKDLDEVTAKINEAQKENKGASFILETLKSYFIEGKFPGVEKLTKEDLEGLDTETTLKCFSVFTGQELQAEEGSEVPQVEGLKAESPKQSSTTPPPQTS